MSESLVVVVPLALLVVALIALATAREDLESRNRGEDSRHGLWHQTSSGGARSGWMPRS